MICERIKVYLYTRVSTAMQIDGYSLEAQRNRMRAYAEFNNFEIVGEYEDAGKSGKSIEGRQQFQQMLKDIQNNKDGVSYVLVFKLSRFGRNAADVLSTLQVMQDYGVILPNEFVSMARNFHDFIGLNRFFNYFEGLYILFIKINDKYSLK